MKTVTIYNDWKKVLAGGILLLFILTALYAGQVTIQARSLYSDSKIHNNHGHYLMTQGKVMEAEKELNKAIKINNRNVSAHINLGVLRTKQKDFKEAIDYFKNAIKIDEKRVTAYYNLGVVYYYAGKYKEALMHFKKVEQLDPFHGKTEEWMTYLFRNYSDLKWRFSQEALPVEVHI